MTLEDLIQQLDVGTGGGAISAGGTGITYSPAYSEPAAGGFAPGMFDPTSGQSGISQSIASGYMGPWDRPGLEWETEGAGNLAKRLANMYGYTGGGAPEGTTWQEMGMQLNPVSHKQLQGAEYGAMRPGMERGIGSLKGELLANLGKIKTGGASSSGFANRQRQAARDVYGKKAVDILSTQGQKRQDYMSSLLEQNVANQELMQSWFPAGGE